MIFYSINLHRIVNVEHLCLIVYDFYKHKEYTAAKMFKIKQ